MNNFFKYLAPNQEDKNWGIFLTVAGITKYLPDMNYPRGMHPKGYNFRWDNGRVLNEYQIVYITEGEGFFETRQEKTGIRSGTVFLLYPGIWHRYKPIPEKGWVEWYVGFNGEAVRQLMSHPLLLKSPVIPCGFRENLLKSFQKIIADVQGEKPGFQCSASAEVVNLISLLITNILDSEFEGKPDIEAVNKSKLIIQQNLDQKIDCSEIAKNLNLGYSNFRKLFKQYTGMPPCQYHLNLRLIKAKELLLHSDKSLKEIAWETGFFSESYFSRTFSRKMGQNPSALRK